MKSTKTQKMTSQNNHTGHPRIPKQTFVFYRAMYPELPDSYVKKVLRRVKQRFGRLDTMTVNYYMTTSLGKVI
jgi:hypothetical protein